MVRCWERRQERERKRKRGTGSDCLTLFDAHVTTENVFGLARALKDKQVLNKHTQIYTQNLFFSFSRCLVAGRQCAVYSHCSSVKLPEGRPLLHRASDFNPAPLTSKRINKTFFFFILHAFLFSLSFSRLISRVLSRIRKRLEVFPSATSLPLRYLFFFLFRFEFYNARVVFNQTRLKTFNC